VEFLTLHHFSKLYKPSQNGKYLFFFLEVNLEIISGLNVKGFHEACFLKQTSNLDKSPRAGFSKMSLGMRVHPVSLSFKSMNLLLHATELLCEFFEKGIGESSQWF